MKTNLKRTKKHVHMTQWDGLQIDRTIYTDETGLAEFIKLNGFVFSLADMYNSHVWTVNAIWEEV